MRLRKIIRIVWVFGGLTFLVWTHRSFQSRDLPINTFISSSTIEVIETDDQLTFKARATSRTTEVIFLQGGLVDPKAYAPFARELASAGFTTHIIKASFRFPQYDYQKILQMFDLSTGSIVIGGHSQGAKTAAQFAYENPGLIKGLFLLGTSHPRDINLSDFRIPILKFYAEFDGLASVEEVIRNRDRLPSHTKMIFIKGGNHAQFGHLGNLLLDDDATITRGEQQAIVKRELLDFLNAID